MRMIENLTAQSLKFEAILQDKRIQEFEPFCELLNHLLRAERFRSQKRRKSPIVASNNVLRISIETQTFTRMTGQIHCLPRFPSTIPERIKDDRVILRFSKIGAHPKTKGKTFLFNAAFDQSQPTKSNEKAFCSSNDLKRMCLEYDQQLEEQPPPASSPFKIICKENANNTTVVRVSSSNHTLAPPPSRLTINQQEDDHDLPPLLPNHPTSPSDYSQLNKLAFESASGHADSLLKFLSTIRSVLTKIPADQLNIDSGFISLKESLLSLRDMSEQAIFAPALNHKENMLLPSTPSSSDFPAVVAGKFILIHFLSLLFL